MIPAPSDVPPLLGVRVPKESSQVPGLLVLYRNQPVVVEASGVAEPWIVAELLVTFMVPVVTTKGAAGIVKDSTDP